MANFIPGWNFNPASETNPLKTKLSITWRGIQPGLKILAQYSQTGLGFSARPNGPENLKKSHVMETESQPGPRKELEHAHWLCFRTSVNFLTEICVLRPGWNWACNHNNISAQWAEQNFSPGWNSTCNQALTLLLSQPYFLTYQALNFKCIGVLLWYSFHNKHSKAWAKREKQKTAEQVR